MTKDDPRWRAVWAELRSAASALPRCSDHPEYPQIQTLRQSVPNDILSIDDDGIRVRSHITMKDRRLAEPRFRRWWSHLDRDGSVRTRPGESPWATNSVIYAAFFVRCLPRLVEDVGNDQIRLLNRPAETTLDPQDADVSEEAGIADEADDPETFAVDAQPFVLRQIRQRRGQAKFRDALRKHYGDRCAMSGCDLLDVLEAAHIRPYSDTSSHDVRNGLLLRADLHTLFDLNLIGVSEDLAIKLHPRVERVYRSVIAPHLLVHGHTRPSADALAERFAEFTKSCKAV